jgi:tungstate transport system substrate-binding protein
MTLLRSLAAALGAGLLVAAASLAADEKPFLTLASTTSTRDSGLLDAILPKFQAKTGIEVRVVAVGTGQAIDMGRRGDADALLVHDRQSEDAFVAEKHALFRRDVMYNDFVLVGPQADPARVGAATGTADAFARIARARAPFVSRGDDSGTHKAERRLWRAAGIDPGAGSGQWYREAGGGMSATLGIASETGAYTLTDRATWLATKSRRDLAIVYEDDPPLRNPYGVLVVNPALHPHVKVALATKLADWLTGPEGRAAIEAFRVEGQPVFFLLPPAETRVP